MGRIQPDRQGPEREVIRGAEHDDAHAEATGGDGLCAARARQQG